MPVIPMTTDPTTADPAAPDDKDWTWVLERPCPDCGFDAARGAGPEGRRTGPGRRELAAGAGRRRMSRRRPAPQVWSVPEYGATAGTCTRSSVGGSNLMLQQDDPQFPNWDQDVTALEKRYWEDDPAVVAVELALRRAAAADGFDAVTGRQWARTGRRSNGSVFTVSRPLAGTSCTISCTTCTTSAGR